MATFIPFHYRQGSIIVTYLVFFAPGTNVTQNGNSLTTNLDTTLNKTDDGNVFLGQFRVDPSQLTETGNTLFLHFQNIILHDRSNKVITVYIQNFNLKRQVQTGSLKSIHAKHISLYCNTEV